MSDARVSALKESPREGLPWCICARAEYDNRVAGWGDWEACGADHNKSTRPARFEVQAGFKNNGKAIVSSWHPELVILAIKQPSILTLYTDSLAEAETAWQRAEHWVRTGELP